MALNKNSLAGLMGTTPKVVTSKARTEAVEKKRLGNEYTQITVLESGSPELELEKWIGANKELVDKTFREDRIILFRGFKPLAKKSLFSEVVRQLSGSELLEYTEPSTPRTQLEEKIYSSTEFPEEQFIVQHNEHSYSNHWPLKVFFYCETPAAQGGQTPVCDSRAVYRLLRPETVRKFEENGVLYVRNFSEEMDISWQQFFQTEDKDRVRAYCQEKNIRPEWKDNGELRTSQPAQSSFVHPELGEKVWFNQAHLFHYTNLNREVYEFLLENYGEENLPRNAYYGNGNAIEDETLEEIRAAYDKAMLAFDWQEGDLIMIDNMLYSHGRTPFKGKRSILVAMTDEYPQAAPAAGEPLVGQKQVSGSRKNTAEHFIGKMEAENTESALKYKLAIAYRIMAALNLEEGGISGHISLKVPGSSNQFWVNPFGLLSEEVTPDNLILVNEEGQVLSGDHPVNVAGFCIHAIIHKMYPGVHCIVHTHAPWGTAFAALDSLIEPVDQNCCMFFENHSLYREFNGPVNDVDDSMKLAKALDGRSAVILANHGALTCGESVETAVMYMVALERACRLNIIARQAGNYKLVSDDVARMTKEWIANPIGFKIEFDALQRKMERTYPDLINYKK
ncbi:MAG TPA: class II aldolase/adducin family protein [Flavisolibacter sp.]|jgi:ribulose-5-phosphate 4-epimerase/fuculose-1-phosphate aldolase/alpha-ketoglutarate-dependent taurine dioxygenase